MPKTVADGLWEMLVSAGVRRCYGIVGDALNPVVDAMRRNGSVDFVHVRHEEYGVFAAVAAARLTGTPVAVCGTAGPGVAHLINGMLDARKERVPIIVLAGDTESGLLDSETVEELNPYQFFASAAVYVGRLVNPRQLRTLVTSAVTAAVAKGGPAVVALPGDVAAAEAPAGSLSLRLLRPVRAAASADDPAAMAAALNEAGTVAIFGGYGCADAQAEVRALAARLSAPVGARAVRHGSRQPGLRRRHRGDGCEGHQNRRSSRRGFRAPDGPGAHRRPRRGRRARRPVRPGGAGARARGDGRGVHTICRQAGLHRPSR
jgi:pyruvate dehydrogenase (quinone)